MAKTTCGARGDKSEVAIFLNETIRSGGNETNAGSTERMANGKRAAAAIDAVHIRVADFRGDTGSAAKGFVI